MSFTNTLTAELLTGYLMSMTTYYNAVLVFDFCWNEKRVSKGVDPLNDKLYLFPVISMTENLEGRLKLVH